ncbi:MAG: hypothetical protein ACOC4L_03295 [Halanaerobium sp.]
MSLIIIINFSSAQPVVTDTKFQFDFSEGYLILDPLQDYIKQDEKYKLNFFVLNTTSGNSVNDTQVDCDLFIADDNGKIIYQNNSTYDSDGYWHNNISENTFNETGTFNYGILCQDDNDRGGAVEGLLEILEIPDELDLTDIIFLIFTFSILLLMLFGSIKLVASKEDISYSQLASLKRKNLFSYYTAIMKNNLHIVGWFGIYLITFFLVAVINDTLFKLSLTELAEITKYLTIILGWGLIPFIIIWIVWLAVRFFMTVTYVIKYQFGSIR